MTVALRRAVAGEGLVLVGLHLATCGLVAESSLAAAQVDSEIEWVQRLGDARHQTQAFVAEDDGILVGTVAAGPCPDDPDSGHVSRLYVDPSCVGRGIGTLLHDRAIIHLAAHGFVRATLSLCGSDPEIRGWYERRGWQATIDSGGHSAGTELQRMLHTAAS